VQASATCHGSVSAENNSTAGPSSIGEFNGIALLAAAGALSAPAVQESREEKSLECERDFAIV
jgi:uncharacterized protein YfiM (DUF2279 family)